MMYPSVCFQALAALALLSFVHANNHPVSHKQTDGHSPHDPSRKFPRISKEHAKDYKRVRMIQDKDARAKAAKELQAKKRQAEKERAAKDEEEKKNRKLLVEPWECCWTDDCTTDCDLNVEYEEDCYFLGYPFAVHEDSTDRLGDCLENDWYECCDSADCDFTYCYELAPTAEECFSYGASYSIFYWVDSADRADPAYCLSGDHFDLLCCERDDCDLFWCDSWADTPENCYAYAGNAYYIDDSGTDPECKIADPVNFDPTAPFDCCTHRECHKESCHFYGISISECAAMGFEYAQYFEVTSGLAQSEWPPVGPCLRVGAGPVNPGLKNDPHLTTWNHTMLEWHGECDVVFLHAPHFHTPGDQDQEDVALDLHVRTKIRYEYSYIETAVVKIGDDTLEVVSFGEYFLNGVATAALPATIGGFTITHTQPDKKKHIFKIELGPDEDLKITAFKDIVSVDIENASSSRFRNSVGMLGEFGGKDRLLGRDGVTVMDDTYALAQEWQVRAESDGMLFQSVRAPQYPDKCRLPTPKEMERRRLGPGTISREDAEIACSHLMGAMKDACIFDVLATGDLDIAHA